MPIIDTSIKKAIEQSLIDANTKREEEHESSGKLSASMLYQPLRVQILKTIGAPRKPFDAYVLGKFKRGNDVEDWFVDHLDEMGVLTDKQMEVEYRGAVGYIDALVDSKKMQFKDGLIPHEIKSVVNSKLKRITKTEVDYHYKLQGCFYAMAIGRPSYAIDIISAEDLRVNIYIFKTRILSRDVDKTIDAYDKAIEIWNTKKELPEFVANPKVPWTRNVKYAMFEEFWITASDKQVIKKLEELK